jgi:CubicO group peptidase (beta-lactamase class C family)
MNHPSIPHLILAAVAFLLGVSECSASTNVPEDTSFACKAVSVSSLSQTANSPAAASAVSIPPGQIDAAIHALDGIVQDRLARTGVPGIAIAVVHNDVVVYAKGFGVREVGTDKKVDENTVFQLASISKPVGATVIAKVVGKGKVQWNTPVVKHLRNFELSSPYATRNVTLGDLYSHRSGLPDHAGDLLEDLGFGRTEILRRLRFEPLAPFRATYAYTNFGVTAAAEAVAKSEGMAWEELSKQVLYRPLGMTSTSSRFSDYDNSPNKALLHVRVGDHWEAKYTRRPDSQSPAGGVSSSIADMAKWLRLQLANGKFNGQEIINAKALIQTRCPYMMSNAPDTSISRASFYGLGMGIAYDEAGRVRFSHSGAFALGAATTIAMLPSEKLGIVALTNGMPVGLPEAVISSFLDLVELGSVQRDWLALYGSLFAQLFQNPSRLANQTPLANPAPPKANSAYDGTYLNSYYGSARIVERSQGLVMLLGPKHLEFPLKHWDDNTFSYIPTGENADGISAVDFTAGSGGRFRTMMIENLNENKLGTFTRDR